MLRRFLCITGLLILTALFFAGVGRLCLLRFRRGDVYPRLSSLRADPLGVKGLYDAIAESGEQEVDRNYRPLDKLQGGQKSTLFYLGADLNESSEDLEDLLQLAMSGKRVVIAFDPMTSESRESKHSITDASPTPTPTLAPDQSKEKPEKKTKKHKKAKAKKDKKEEPEEESVHWISWKARLERAGFTIQVEPNWERLNLNAQPASPEASTSPVLSWHGVAWIEAPGQKALYLCANKPVIVERSMGKGSLVLATDSYFLTNEALRKERASGLLAELIGANRTVVFDEFHLHSVEQAGVSTLVRQYRLEGVFVVFAILAALFVWKNAMPLIPRLEDTSLEGNVEKTLTGRGATEGFVNLLRRSIPPGRIVAVCIEEWNSAFAHLRGQAPDPETTPDPVTQFSALAKKLSNKRTDHE